MPAFIDLTGNTIGRLTVLSRNGSIDKKPAWLCQCECGKQVTVRGGDLRSGHHRSCGCLHADWVASNFKKHGGCGGLTYHSWQSMIARCYNPKTFGYDRYGGRGITVCERWRTFENFLADVGERPSKSYTLDRYPNRDGNYEPGNVRWASKITQSNNRNDNLRFTYNGKTQTLTEWCRELGLDMERVRSRIRIGWEFERAIAEPITPNKDRVDMAGQRVGMLTVLGYSHTANKRAFWLCRCDCGTEKTVSGKELRNKHTKSCGCLKHRSKRS